MSEADRETTYQIGDKVVVTNRDSAMYGMRGKVILVKPARFLASFPGWRPVSPLATIPKYEVQLTKTGYIGWFSEDELASDALPAWREDRRDR